MGWRSKQVFFCNRRSRHDHKPLAFFTDKWQEEVCNGQFETNGYQDSSIFVEIYSGSKIDTTKGYGGLQSSVTTKTYDNCKVYLSNNLDQNILQSRKCKNCKTCKIRTAEENGMQTEKLQRSVSSCNPEIKFPEITFVRDTNPWIRKRFPENAHLVIPLKTSILKFAF